MSECQLYLEAVPALFRLELLENIFSLLFLSSADLASTSPQTPPGPVPTPSSYKGTREIAAENPEENTNSSGTSPSQPEGPGVGNDAQGGVVSSEPSKGHPDLGHLTYGCRGFLADVRAMEGFLRLIREGLEGLNVPVPGQDEQAAESLGCSVTAETFETRLQRLSKRTAEAQWRLQVVTKNQRGRDGGEEHTKSFIFHMHEYTSMQRI